MFVVLIDIDVLDFPTCHREVYGAEIERAVPFLKTKSFCNTASIKIYSKILLKNCQHWFSVPNYAVNAKDLVGQAIDRFYGETSNIASNNESATALLSPVSNPPRSLEDLQFHIRDLRRKRNRITAFEKGLAVAKTEDDHALLGSKVSVLQELKKSEDQLRNLL